MIPPRHVGLAAAELRIRLCPSHYAETDMTMPTALLNGPARFAVSLALVCSPLQAAEYFLVGDVNPQSRCQFGSIQAALVAAAANGPDLDYVMVANDAAYTGQALLVGAQSVLIEGGYANCDLDVDEAQPFADLAGNGSDPVIRIEPASAGNYEVRLSNLRIRGGGRDSFNGGGVRLRTSTNAHVALSLDRTEITGNRGQAGGGLHAERAGSPAGSLSVTLNPGTRIHANTAAGSGGGISLWGGNLFIAADAVRIDDNVAGGAGGGIATLPGSFIAVGNPNIDLWPGRKDVTGARIENNRAGTTGGGLYLSGAGTTMEAHELIVESNRAEISGGGITVADGAVLTMLRETMNAFGWYCPRELDCTRIGDNQVADGIATGARGGAVAVYGDSRAYLIQTLVRDNRAQDGSAIFVDGAGVVHTEGTVFTGNRSYDEIGQTGALIRTRFTLPSAAPSLRLTFSTFVGNQRRATDGQLRPAVDVVGIQGTSLQLYSSAVFDGGVTMYNEWGADCVVAGATAGFSANGIIARPTYTDRPFERIFIAPGRRDWQPRFDSPLTDVCDTLNANPEYRDRDLRPRCRDEVKPDRWGTCDVGAWENDQIMAAEMD